MDRQSKDLNVMKEINQYLIDYNLPDGACVDDYLELQKEEMQLMQ